MLKRTPLNEVHRKLGARMVPFGGWDMPVQYTGVLDEHRAVRNQAGLFDISHMGEIFVEGPGATDFINFITTNDITKITDGQCQYAIMCREDGTCVDDVISYRFSPQKYLVVVNASNTDKDFEWMQKNAKGDVRITNKSADYCQLALQGPRAQEILSPLVATPLASLKTFHFVETTLKGKSVLVSRTGYTAEDGYEIYGAASDSAFLWQTLMDTNNSRRAQQAAPLQPIGLGARDSLRLEGALSLFGHEISDTINPLEARLSFFVKLDKPDFIGKKFLQQVSAQGPKRQLVGLKMVDAGIPREGYAVFSQDQKIGVITSGTFSPTLEVGIGLALVGAPLGAPQLGSERAQQAAPLQVGTQVFVEIRNQKKKAEVVKLPFYRRKKI